MRIVPAARRPVLAVPAVPAALALLAALAMLAALALPGLALAHTGLTTSSPADGASVSPAPATLTLTFGAPVRLARVQLTPPGGAPAALALDRKAPAAASFTLALPPLPAGEVRVTWRALGDDGHIMSGEFAFTVK